MRNHLIVDGTPVTVGRRVFTYDWKYGTIVDDRHNADALAKEHKGDVVHPCDSWFNVLHEDGTTGTYDCSRLTTKNPNQR